MSDIRHITRRPDIVVAKINFVIFFKIAIQLGSVRIPVCLSKRPYVCLSVRPSIWNMYELQLTYCNSTKNLRNYSFVSLLEGIIVVKYIRLNCRIPGRIITIYNKSLLMKIYLQKSRVKYFILPFRRGRCHETIPFSFLGCLSIIWKADA